MPRKITPQIAPVRPRVISPNTGEIVLLEDVARLHLQGVRSSLEVVGGPGLGKTTALAHLAALPESEEFVFADDIQSSSIPSVPSGKALIYSSRRALSGQPLRLAGWTKDDLIEYLLARAPDQCASVMARFRNDDGDALEGNPQLMCIVADELVQRSDIAVREALSVAIDRRVPNENVDRQACLYAVALLLQLDITAQPIEIADLRARPELLQLLSHRQVQIHFATKHLTSLLDSGVNLPDATLPYELIVQTANSIQDNSTAIRRLQMHFANRHKKNVAMAASILHCVDSDWAPRRTTNLNLSSGYFSNADWEGNDLIRINLSDADVSNSNLQDANFKRAMLERTNFSGCNLQNARLERSNARRANFSNAKLERAHMAAGKFSECYFAFADLRQVSACRASFQCADFTSATLKEANLEGAHFTRAVLDGTDLRSANLLRTDFAFSDFRTSLLERANFCHAILNQCNFENISVRSADFSQAHMTDVLLTGSEMVGVKMKYARMNGAGLADIDWQNCDLRRADLNNCSFHLGSTRCGLVGSDYPSHGTRTGFYTDDFDSHLFRSPEEVRKASLRDCDLRGANVFLTDFYLVDLRGAQYDADQETHFRNCKAILDDWNDG